MGAGQSHYDYDGALANDKTTPQSVEVPEGTAPEAGCSIPRRPLYAKDSLSQGYRANENEEYSQTIWSLFQRGVALKPNGNFLGTRKYTVADAPCDRTDEEKARLPKSYKFSGYAERKNGAILRGDYVFNTYSEINEAAANFGRGLLTLGAKAQDNVGIFSVNRAEWIIASLGFQSQNMRTVSLYATLGPNAVEYIVNHAETNIVIVSKENLPTLMKNIGALAGTMKHVIFMDALFDGRYGNVKDTVQDADVAACAEAGVTLHAMSAIIAAGAANATVPLNLPTKDDLAFIMYTSGTTGEPKGAMLSHFNIASTIGVLPSVIGAVDESITGHYLSYLPLAHIFETVVQVLIWVNAGTVYMSQGDTRFLLDDIQACRPTFLAGVPRVFLKFYQSIWDGISKMGCVKRWYIGKAYTYQCQQLREGKPLDANYDAKVFSLMREKVGFTRIKILITGASPCPPYLVEFMRVLTNAWFSQGYGMTEASAGTSISLRHDNHIGECGPPLGCNEIKLADIPDMNYYSNASPQKGEILLSGPNVFQGYYKNEVNTNEALYFDANGKKWLRTGDVGRWNPNGTLSIIDRKKALVKLAQGEYFSPSYVAEMYEKSLIVSQLWAYGNSFKAAVVGVLVVNPSALYEWANANGFWTATGVAHPTTGGITDAFIKAYKDLIESKRAEVTAWALKELRQFEGKLQGYEKLKALWLESEIDSTGAYFSEANGLLTPTFKKKVKPLTEHYLPKLQQLYVSLGEKPQDGEIWY